MAKLNVAIVGLGMAATPHAKSYLDLADRVSVRYAYSPSQERRAAFAAKFPFPLADDLDTILRDKAVDAVAILTPPNTHLDLVERCAAAGKHVLLEKPLEITTERSRALVETCRRAGVKLAVTLQHRFRPAGSCANCSRPVPSDASSPRARRSGYGGRRAITTSPAAA